MRLLIIGGSGLVGLNIVQEAETNDIEVYATHNTSPSEYTEISLDKTDQERTKAIAEEVDPDVIIDTAAYHAVDDCETNREYAWTVNATGTRNAAVAASSVGAHYIYLSTDYVFPGNKSDTPYSEDDPVSPVNYYAETKYAGERASRIVSDATILRPSVVYGLARNNFTTWALGELESGEEINIVNDQFSTTTYAPDLARACVAVAKKGLTGLYHAAGPVRQSRFQFTRQLAEAFDYDPSLVTPITTEEFGQDAPRPTDGSLDSSRLYNSVEYEFRSPQTAFENMRAQNSL
jgi:dTDP-4-dehydrorhamnose reductase